MSNHVIHLTDKSFKDEIAKGVTLVDFTASWCGPCRTIAPIIDQLGTALAGKAKVAKLDIDEGQETANQEQITSVPTLIVYKDGKEVKRTQGVKSLDYLQDFVGAYL